MNGRICTASTTRILRRPSASAFVSPSVGVAFRHRRVADVADDLILTAFLSPRSRIIRRCHQQRREDDKTAMSTPASALGNVMQSFCISSSLSKYLVRLQPVWLKPISQLRFDYDTTTTKNWHVHFLLASNWKQARAIRRSRIVVVS